jgi:hypothetical protein
MISMIVGEWDNGFLMISNRKIMADNSLAQPLSV